MLNNFQFQKYIRTIAENAGWNVVWTDEKLPRTSKNTIYIPKGNATDTEEDWKERLYFAVHEAGGHARFTDFSLLEKHAINPAESLLGAIWNILEDHRVDFLNSIEFAGDRVLSNEVVSNTIDDIRETLSVPSLPPEKQQMREDIYPLLELYSRAASDILPSFLEKEGTFEPFLGTIGKERCKKLLEGNYLEELREIRCFAVPSVGSEATYTLAKRIFKEVYEQDPEKEEEKQKEKQKQGGEGEDKGKPGKEKKPGEGDKEGEEKGKGEGKGEEKETPPNVKYDKLLSESHSDVGESRTDIHFVKRDSCEEGSYTPPTEDTFATYYFNKEEWVGQATIDPYYANYCTRITTEKRMHSTAYERCLSSNPSFSNDVRQRLQVRSRSRWEYAKKKGALHRPSLHRVLVKDAPGYNERVFKTKVVADTLNVAITVLVDTSGSMGVGKYATASAAACMLNESIGNVLHIPLEIVGFTEWGSTPINFVYRTHQDKLVSRDTFATNIASAGSCMSDNADGESVLWAYHRLVQQKQKRKLLIVLSDGSPASSCSRGNIDWYTGHVVKEIEKEKRVEIYGIGILSDSVRHYYKEHIVLNDVALLEPTLLSVIDKKLY